MVSTWLYIGFAVGGLFALIMFLILKIWTHREQSSNQDASRKHDLFEKELREKAMKHLDTHTMIINEENIKYVIQCFDIESACCSEEPFESFYPDDIDESEISFSPRLMIHRGTNDLGKEYMMRSATCTICLDDYRVGDEVVESGNPSCPHVFHRECMLNWLSKDKNCRCPICRQKFIVSNEEPNTLITCTNI